MKVYYSKGWAITFIIAGLILLALNLVLFQLTGKLESQRYVPGFLVMIVGILYLFQPYFELKERSLVTYSLLGFISKRYTIDEISDLTFESNKLFSNRKGTLKRIRISKFVSNKAQWRSFVLIVENSEPGNAFHE